MPRFIVLEAATADIARAAARELAGSEGTVVADWRPRADGRPVVCLGRVETADDASRAVLAAVAGADLVVDAHAPRDVVDQLCDDLRSIGEVSHRVEHASGPSLSPEQRALLAHLLAGASLGEAARALHISRRTADRRLAAARAALGADTTPSALRIAARLGITPPSR
jgi:DNA-directed RNA polymerase specialized sigma24 family protein